ncbi:Asp23/Gls24 family envelope stress response protein [Kribbella qitaiheensis]|uniref:Asp23/Gls24 family envelope stress response protein n=1 Tax=Kribbella qitaiheensis TaxID=1544730 RepID=A0A7G6WWB8_9ACTN|nr:Asp23/Gls24 family envelope stress response protein [Kribbella qitaiheensis]QNE18283.1 Asp23/Gls24 family envelope stress response protein [Kribbella qitaiheensis]
MADVGTLPAATPADPAPAIGLREPGERGRLDISSRAVERIAEAAALQVDPVTRQSATFGRGVPKAHAVLAGNRVRLRVEIAVVWGRPLAEIAAEVRTRVADIVADLTALGVDAVGVDIVAVLIQPETSTDQPARRLL